MTKAEHWRVSSCPQDVAKFATVSQEISKSEDGKYSSVAKANVFILNEDISNFNEQSQKALDPALVIIFPLIGIYSKFSAIQSRSFGQFNLEAGRKLDSRTRNGVEHQPFRSGRP